MSEPKFVCASCRKNEMFFHHDSERVPKMMKWTVTIAHEPESDIPSHSWEIDMPDDFSANTFMTLFKMFARMIK